VASEIRALGGGGLDLGLTDDEWVDATTKVQNTLSKGREVHTKNPTVSRNDEVLEPEAKQKWKKSL